MVVGRKRKTHQSWRAIKATSSIAAELEAMSIRTDTDTPIFTDSQAAIKAIESRPTLQKDKRRIRKLVDREELQREIIAGKVNHRRMCQCKLPEHGTYLTCTKCKVKEHPVLQA
jgi:hypothetical protein